ncbi:glycosyltransferase family protein [Nesterenkonia xinjiangensis]|uniref:Putative glycosyltransferase n=1 Tax=Nesterenkonia xinjiangensis TaxID=225327 RepID=A0A7Z0GKT6_9MICC|nr:glycosyltransferase [Nesterenkonia xinjiangensis]NYJ76951.1 putative glycosyltransferase [Nesterenkonia xinjiangensis]
MSITIAMYSHDSVGLGHARRNRAIAHALAADLPRLTGETVGGLLIAGHPDAARDSLPAGWDWLVLPGFTHTTAGYAARRMSLPAEQMSALRGATVAAAVDAVSPDLFIADRHPFGVGGELTEALDLLRGRPDCRTVLGLRDVLDAPEAAGREWDAVGGAERVAEAYDQMWIYGDAAVYDPRRTGEIPAALAAKGRTTGYLAHGRPDDDGAPAARPYVLTMVGGGSDGAHIALASALSEPPAGHRHLIVTGPQMPTEDVARIREAVDRRQESSPGRGGEPRVQVLRSAGNVPALVRDATAVVSMAGYNSVAEVMATTTPALLVPRHTRRAEQPRRTAALAAIGALDSLPAVELSPQALTRWLAGAVNRRTPRDQVDLDGLTRVGGFAAELIGAARTTPTEVPAHA